MPVFQAGLARAQIGLATIGASNLERDRIFWCGDRIEWMLTSGFHPWVVNEIEQERVLWPGLTLPPIST